MKNVYSFVQLVVSIKFLYLQIERYALLVSVPWILSIYIGVYRHRVDTVFIMKFPHSSYEHIVHMNATFKEYTQSWYSLYNEIPHIVHNIIMSYDCDI